RRLGALPLLRAGLGFILAALLLSAILYSFSRMGFFASLLSVVVIVALALRSQLSAAWKWLGASLAIAVIIVVFAFLSPAPLIERFEIGRRRVGTGWRCG